jgi:hypothetical protein
MHLDPNCYDPEMEPQVLHTDFWGYYHGWDSGPDLVVLGPRHEASEQVPATNVEYKDIHVRMLLRAQHTVGKDGRCAQAPCYRAQKLGRLLLLRKIEAGHDR